MKAFTTLLITLVCTQVFTQKIDSRREFTITIDSKELKEKREVGVYLPNSYSITSESRFPVLYLLDGQNLTKSTLDIYNFLRSKGYIPEMVIVSIPHTNNRSKDYYTFKRGTDNVNEGSNQFMGFMKRELIPRINEDFRCSPFKIIAGHSSSGLFIIHTLIKEPSLFNAYFAFSPAIHHTPKIITILDEALKNNNLGNTYFFGNVGGAEFYKIKDAFEQAKEVMKSNRQSELRFDMELSEIDGHRSTPFIGMYRALEKLYDPVRFNEADYVGKTHDEIIKHFERYSELFGYDTQPKESQLLSKGRYFFSFDTKEHDLNVAQSIYKVADHYYPNSKASFFIRFIDKWKKYGAKDGITYEDSEIPEERSLNSFGYFLLNSKKVQEAIFVFSIVVKQYPNSPNAYDSLGEAYERNGQTARALKMFKKALDQAVILGNKDRIEYYRKNMERVSSRLKG